MAEKERARETEQESGKPSGGGLSLKLIVVILGVMLAEAGAVVAFLSLTGPTAADAAEEQGLSIDEGEQTLEIEVVSDKFQNLQSGRVWQWEVELWVKVKQKNKDHVNARLESQRAEIKQAINNVISRAQHVHLKEPGHETLLRQFTKVMEQFLTADPEEGALFEAVLLPKVRGNPTDF